MCNFFPLFVYRPKHVVEATRPSANSVSDGGDKELLEIWALKEAGKGFHDEEL